MDSTHWLQVKAYQVFSVHGPQPYALSVLGKFGGVLASASNPANQEGSSAQSTTCRIVVATITDGPQGLTNRTCALLLFVGASKDLSCIWDMICLEYVWSKIQLASQSELAYLLLCRICEYIDLAPNLVSTARTEGAGTLYWRTTPCRVVFFACSDLPEPATSS